MNWRLSFVVFFASFLFLALILLLGSMHLFSLFLRRVTAPTPPTIALLLSFRLLLRFSKLLNSHFIKHLESNNLLSDHQYGFRKARSTGDLLSYLTHVWSSSLKNFGESFVVALDISKAFDRVWHKALLAKLPAYGSTPSFCKLISSFLSNHFISVVVDGATSASFPVSSGVPQGSVLSPTLFLLFINDLLHATASDVHSFADDSNLHKSSSFQCQPSSNARSQSRLAMSSTINSDLQSISEWGTRNLVKFNTSKTQLLTISLSNTPSNYPIIFEDSEIPSLNSVNILGLQISSSLSWRDHIVQIAKSASKKLGVLFRCNNILILLNYSNCILVLFVPAWNIALISGVLPLILLFLIGLNQRLSA